MGAAGATDAAPDPTGYDTLGPTQVSVSVPATTRTVTETRTYTATPVVRDDSVTDVVAAGDVRFTATTPRPVAELLLPQLTTYEPTL
jgi:hypothetical protein